MVASGAGAFPGATPLKLLSLVPAAARPDWEGTWFSFTFGQHLKGYGVFFSCPLDNSVDVKIYSYETFSISPGNILC